MHTVGMGNKTTLVSPFYSIEPFLACLKEVNPSRVVLFVQTDETTELKKNLNLLDSTMGKVIEIERKSIPMYDILTVAKSVVEAIEKENHKGNKVVVNYTSGRRTVALGALIAAYARPDLVERVVYSTEENNELLDLPKLGFNLSKTKRAFLEELGKSKKSVPEIAKKLGVTKGMAYVHLRELKASGMVGEENKLTVAGRLALL